MEETHLAPGRSLKPVALRVRLPRLVVSAIILPRLGTESLFFAVDAAAIGLTVHPQFLRDPDPLGPACSKIQVEEGNPLLYGHALTDAPDEIVLLKAAVEKGSRKGVESVPSGDPCRLGKTDMVTAPAPLFFAKGDLSKKLLERVCRLPDNAHPDMTGVRIERLDAFPIL